MIGEIKEIKIAEIQKRLSEVAELTKQLEAAKAEMDRLSQTLLPTKRYSWIQKNFTKRKEYKEFQETRKRLEQERESKSHIYKELYKMVYMNNDNDTYTLERRLSEIEEAKTLEELGLNFNTASELLEQHEIPVVLTEQDKYIRKDGYNRQINNPRGRLREIEGKEDLICVHKTRFVPNDSRIKSSKEAGATVNSEIQINGQTYKYSYFNPRNTVHFSVNDEVSSHAYGQWDDTRYAILIPFNDIPREQIRQAASMDTYTEGGVNLTENSWIICPKDEVTQVKQKNPNVHVIGYEGENVSEYSPALLSALGYKAESVGMWSWGDEKDQIKYNEIMEREGLTMTPHSYTEESNREKQLASMNKAIAIFRTIKNNNLVKDPEDVGKILEEVEKNMCFPTFDGVMFSAIGYDMKNLKEFISNLESNGFPLSGGMRTVLAGFNGQIYERRLLDDEDTLIDKQQLSERESAFLEEILQEGRGRREKKLGDICYKLLSFAVLDGIQREHEYGVKNQEIIADIDKTI